MKTIYRCEVCRNDYDTADAALACEAQPVPNGPPSGLILTDDYLAHQNRGDKPYAALCTGAVEIKGHWHRTAALWFRGNGRPDDEEPRFDVVCINHWSERPDTDTTADSFKRALAKCRAMGWTPKVIVDGRARNFSEGPQCASLTDTQCGLPL